MTAPILVSLADVPVPDSHLDLLARPIAVVLTTMLPDGQPQARLVPVDYDGRCARVTATLEPHEGCDLVLNPHVSLLVVDPDDTSRFVQVRGEAELVMEGVETQLDEPARLHTAHRSDDGSTAPIERRGRETRVTCRIHARRVTLDAIHR